MSRFTKPFLLTAAATTLMLSGASLFTAPAAAQKGKVLEPLSRWSVSSVDASKAGGRPYCAMARRYSQNLILTLAQNRSFESSLALDFQTPHFKKQQLFSIALDPGYGEMREFEMRPASSRAFVIRLGNDKAFFDALRKTGFLRVGIGDEYYHFDIRDIDIGKAQIDMCVAALDGQPVYGAQGADTISRIEPAAGEKAATPVSVSQDLSHDKKIEALKAGIKNLKKEKFLLEAMLEKERNTYAAQNDEPEISENAAQHITSLSGEIALLEQENERLLNKIAGMSANVETAAGEETGDSGAASDSSDIALNHLKRENETLMEILSKREAEIAKANEDLDVLQALRNENDQLKALLAENEVNDLSGLRKQMDTLRQRNAQLLAEIDVVRAQVAAEFQEQIAAQQHENDALKLALGQGVQDAEPDEATSDPVIRMQRSVMALEQEKEALRAELDAVKAANLAMSEEMKTIRQTRAELEEMKIRNSELQDEIAASLAAPVPLTPEQKAEFVAQYESKIEALESVNEELHIALDKAAGEAEKLESEAQSHTAVLEALKEENKGLRKQLASAASGDSTDAKRIASLVEQNLRLKNNVSSLQEQLNEMRAELTRTQRFVELPDSEAANMQQVRRENVPEAVRTAKVDEQAESEDIVRNAAPEAVQRSVDEDVAEQGAPIETVERVAETTPQTLHNPDAHNPDAPGKQTIARVKPKQPAMYEHQAQRMEAELASRIEERGLAATMPMSAQTAPVPISRDRGVDVVELDDNVEIYADMTTKGAPAALKAPEQIKSEDPQSPTRIKKERELQQKLAMKDMARSFEPDLNIQALLNDSHIVLGSQVESIDNRASTGKMSYRWQSGGVFGSAELKPIKAAGQFEAYVYDYLNITEKRCDGDFAIIPERSMESSIMRVDSYEIACVGGSVDSSASLLFVSKNNTFSVLAQEASMAQMSNVLDARDRLVATLKKYAG